jgi:hypothetical protein
VRTLFKYIYIQRVTRHICTPRVPCPSPFPHRPRTPFPLTQIKEKQQQREAEAESSALAACSFKPELVARSKVGEVAVEGPSGTDPCLRLYQQAKVAKVGGGGRCGRLRMGSRVRRG